MSSLPLTRHGHIARLADPAAAEAWSALTAIYEQAIHRSCRSRGLQEIDARRSGAVVFRALAISEKTEMTADAAKRTRTELEAMGKRRAEPQP